MRCTAPRTVGFFPDGKTLSWSPKTYSKEFATFQLPCGKCLECRLEYAKQWAIRSIHEAQLHEENSFITLTYDDENLTSDRLVYSDFQKFMKKLRKTTNNKIGCFVTGQYGDKKKRPHWHAILFNYSPPDGVHKYTSDRGDKVYESKQLEKLWGKGRTEYGSVTFESAGYCARYAAKKLSHGKDNEHEFHPISKKSSKQAIGKKWIERFWPDVFSDGYIMFTRSDGTKVKASIPRYYEKWLKQHQPEAWKLYVTQLKEDNIKKAALRAEKEIKQDLLTNMARHPVFKGPVRTRTEAASIILREKFKQLQEKLKL